MKRRTAVALIIMAVCLAAASWAAADTFRFAEKSVTVFEGETIQGVLEREGAPAEGVVTWSSASSAIAGVDDSGVVTAVKKGQTTVTASVKSGKRTWKAQMSVRVLRAVKKVTLNTQRIEVYKNDDPVIFDLLEEGTELPVILLPAGRGITLTTTCTPEDASSRSVIYTSTDAGVARVSGRELRGIQAGECDLIIQSEQNPEVTQEYHVLVTQPITRIEIQTADRSVAAGESITLTPVFTPAGASMKKVTWSSRAPSVAAVDENGVVTGLKKGSAAIEAKAADGSGKTASVYITVTQKAESLSLNNTYAEVVTGRYVTLSPQIMPRETNDRTVTWSSSDESVATVGSNGSVKGIKAGTCEITCVSNSNPALSATATVKVIQRVTKIEFGTANGISFPVRTTQQLTWSVYPDDATVKDVKFTSSSQKVATVDQNGLVTGVSRGKATITAAATDGSGRRATIRVEVTQPVEGVSIQYGVYHVQIHRNLSVKALIQPSNANNYHMSWSTGNSSVATVRGSKNIGSVHGEGYGTTTVTGVTEDGGYSASAEIRVADFNGAIMVEELYVRDNKIRITFRNMSNFTVERVYFTVQCYDTEGEPMVCNTDGTSTSFDGNYPVTLYPGERTEHGYFNFGKGSYSKPLGKVVLHITGWKDSEGYTRNISSEDDQPTMYWYGDIYRQVPYGEEENG